MGLVHRKTRKNLGLPIVGRATGKTHSNDGARRASSKNDIKKFAIKGLAFFIGVTQKKEDRGELVEISH